MLITIKKKHGMTLIEIILAMAILGLVVAFLFPVIVSAFSQISINGLRSSELKSVNSDVELVSSVGFDFDSYDGFIEPVHVESNIELELFNNVKFNVDRYEFSSVSPRIGTTSLNYYLVQDDMPYIMPNYGDENYAGELLKNIRLNTRIWLTSSRNVALTNIPSIFWGKIEYAISSDPSVEFTDDNYSSIGSLGEDPDGHILIEILDNTKDHKIHIRHKDYENFDNVTHLISVYAAPDIYLLSPGSNPSDIYEVIEGSADRIIGSDYFVRTRQNTGSPWGAYTQVVTTGNNNQRTNNLSRNREAYFIKPIGNSYTLPKYIYNPN